MSSSSYCQGLQSCLEPSRSGEPRVLRLKLSPPKSNISRSSPSPRNPVPFDSDCDSETNKDNKPDMGGWSFLQSLDGSSKSTNDEANSNDKVYIPPTVRRSASTLNARSLEMCTESLGSETGSDVSDSSDEMSLTSPDIKHETTLNFETYKEIIPSRLGTRSSVMKRSASFPPPLSSMSGSTSVQVRPRREGGRLVLEAVSTTACRTYFQAERVNGRLKLHMLRNCSPKCKNKEAICIDHVDENEKARNGVEEEVESINVEDEYEDIDGDADDDDDYIDEEEVVKEEELEENKVEEEGEMEKLAKAMSSRCMEGGSCDGKATLLNNKNWETYCHVAS